MRQQLQRAGRRTDMIGGDAQILSRGGEAPMTEQQLNLLSEGTVNADGSPGPNYRVIFATEALRQKTN